MNIAAASSRCLSHFAGTWFDAGLSVPPYREGAPAAARDGPQSKHIASSPMCRRQHSWRWQWRSFDNRCPFQQPTRAQICRRLARRRVLLYGDSLTQQFFISLASLAGNASSAWKPAGCERMRHLECVRVCGSSSANVCHRTRFGLALDETPRPPHNCSMKPSVVQPLDEMFAPSCLRRFDVIVLSEGAHWVGNDGAVALEECFVERGIERSKAAVESQNFVSQLFEAQMQKNAAFLQANVAGRGASGSTTTTTVANGQSAAAAGGPAAAAVQLRPRVVFRTTAPGNPPADILAPDTPGGVPPVFTAPASSANWVDAMVAKGSSAFNHHMLPRLNDVARRAYSAHAPRLEVMDTAEAMARRVDGHLDLLHHCLPGPPDFYSYVLWNFLLPAGRA